MYLFTATEPMKIRIQVKPNTKHKSALEQQPDGTYVAYVKEPAVEGRANSVAIVLIAKHFGVPKSAVQIKSGASSRYKVIEIE